MAPPSIYVERVVDGSVDDLWERTQDPNLHERWDLRFSDIEYLPREDGEPQEFRYATRMGFGVAVEGTGTSRGTREAGSETTSVLEFRSDDPKSLITEGRGFWRYVPVADGTRFLTEYNYDTRFGRVGAFVDRVAFRPLMGWATAFGFDVLALWVEEGRPPESTLTNALVHGVCRVALAFAFVFLGLVPKVLLALDALPAWLVAAPTERDLLGAALPAGAVDPALLAVGVVEVLFGLALLAFWRSRPLLLVAAVAAVSLTTGAAALAPAHLAGPFSPLVLTACIVALGVAGYLASERLPTARRCLRAPPEDA